SSSVPSAAAARPLPNELTTPPVRKMYFMRERSVLRERVFAPALLHPRACPRRAIHLSRRAHEPLHHFQERAIARAIRRALEASVSISQTGVASRGGTRRSPDDADILSVKHCAGREWQCERNRARVP